MATEIAKCAANKDGEHNFQMSETKGIMYCSRCGKAYRVVGSNLTEFAEIKLKPEAQPTN